MEYTAILSPRRLPYDWTDGGFSPTVKVPFYTPPLSLWEFLGLQSSPSSRSLPVLLLFGYRKDRHTLVGNTYFFFSLLPRGEKYVGTKRRWRPTTLELNISYLYSVHYISLTTVTTTTTKKTTRAHINRRSLFKWPSLFWLNLHFLGWLYSLRWKKKKKEKKKDSLAVSNPPLGRFQVGARTSSRRPVIIFPTHFLWVFILYIYFFSSFFFSSLLHILDDTLFLSHVVVLVGPFFHKKKEPVCAVWRLKFTNRRLSSRLIVKRI